jgi:hypothetical protein
MPGPTLFRSIERSAYRSTLEDGIPEILMSTFFICTAIATWDRRFAWIYFAPFLLVMPALRILKRRLTYPRIGYVEPHSETKRELVGGMARYFVIVLGAFAVALFLFGDVGDPAHWFRWSPVPTAALFSGGFLYAAGRSGLVRFHVYTMVAMALAVVLALIDPPGRLSGLALFLMTMGIVTAASGGVVLVRFLRDHPVADDEVSDVRS